MGKRPTRTNNVEGMEVDAIKVALRDIEKQQKTQSDTMKEVLILLRGSVAMGVNGILEDHKEIRKQLIEFSKGLADLERWQQEITDSKGKITITVSQLFTRTMAVIGALGTMVAIILGIKELMG